MIGYKNEKYKNEISRGLTLKQMDIAAKHNKKKSQDLMILVLLIILDY